METVKIGVVGCGNISGIYLKNTASLFEAVEPVAVADLDPARAKAKAEEHGIGRACSPEELLADPEVEIVVNLTPPAAHAPVALQALEAGKHVHNEKPFATTREDGRRLLHVAAEKGLRVGCAPDTFLGGGHQTCRALIDAGAIGAPVAATAFMMGRGPEGWHPDPEFFYKPGGGPMFDMGPYYLTALINLLGPVKRVCGLARITHPERTIGSGAKQGQKIKVEVPTHVVGVLDFASGAVGTIITSFDVAGGAELPRIEVYGSEGTLSVPDPNAFKGPVRVRKAGEKEFTEVPVTRPYVANSRGIGVADMACGLRSGRPHRTTGALAYHVLDVMHAIHDASHEGRCVLLDSTCDRPAPLPEGLEEGTLDT